MDITEYTQQVKPRKKRSKLIPFSPQIQELKTRGYTDQQIREWLAANQIQVSREAVRKFIKNHLTEAPIDPANQPMTPQPLPETVVPAAEATTESRADKLRKQVTQQKLEAASTQFRHDKTGNNT